MARNTVKVNLSVTIRDLNAGPERLEGWLRERFVDEGLYGVNVDSWDVWARGPEATVVSIDVLDAEVVEDQGDDNNAEDDDADSTEGLTVGVLLSEQGDPALNG